MHRGPLEYFRKISIDKVAYLRYCDPVQAGILDNYDSMMPYFTKQLFNNTPGMLGIFISGAYSATLSTISSGLNSCVTVLFKVHIFEYKSWIEKQNEICIFLCETFLEIINLGHFNNQLTKLKIS